MISNSLYGCRPNAGAGAKLLSLCILVQLASGCAGVLPPVHKVSIQQGNVITQQMVDRLKPGMSRSQVEFVMGKAIVETPFDHDRWDYVYTLHRAGGARYQRSLSLYFENDRLSRFEGNFKPQKDDGADLARPGASASAALSRRASMGSRSSGR